MLTRLRVTGFKNLSEVDLRFGPFTCVAGANGVGKSNLFDAITFMSALADRSLVDAALSVRVEGGRAADIRGLFRHVGTWHEERMSLEAEMIVPAEGTDDLGQRAEASITFLRYRVDLGYQTDESPGSVGSLELLHESLEPIHKSEAGKQLLFPHSGVWRGSAIVGRGRRNAAPFISTEVQGGQRQVRLHQEGVQGRPLSRLAANLPRTVLSVANAAESPTVLLARQEMRSWRLLQLEPTSLRRPDDFSAVRRLGPDGSHLAATLYRLAGAEGVNGRGQTDRSGGVYARVANRLAGLIEEVREVSVDRDEKRELLTLVVSGRDGAQHAARALSDGTLRFLALAVLEEDRAAPGLICLEEPENGIHPARIPAMLELLQDIASDVHLPVGTDNPLRQVIVNTHSPSIVRQVPEDSLVVADLAEAIERGRRSAVVRFRGLAGTWRRESGGASLGDLLAYLSPEERAVAPVQPAGRGGKRLRRVMDRPEIQPMLFP